MERVDEAGASPKVTLVNGDTMVADVVVGADGIRSRVREVILGNENVHAADSPNCAFRATVPRELMLADPDVAHLMSDINSNCWIGHGRHVMAYPIRNGEMYNLVMSHPGKAAVGRWNEPGNLGEMREHYRSFDPTIQKVIAKVDSCLKWKIADLPPLTRWVGPSGHVVVLGDAAHAMLPYLAQGAATAIEDGAALAECISRATDASMIPEALGAFQEIRKSRCEIIQSGSRGNGDIWHMPDGPGQQQRDRDMMDEIQGVKKDNKPNVQNPNRWSDKSFQPWLFGYDAIKEVSDKSPRPEIQENMKMANKIARPPCFWIKSLGRRCRLKIKCPPSFLGCHPVRRCLCWSHGLGIVVAGEWKRDSVGEISNGQQGTFQVEDVGFWMLEVRKVHLLGQVRVTETRPNWELVYSPSPDTGIVTGFRRQTWQVPARWRPFSQWSPLTRVILAPPTLTHHLSFTTHLSLLTSITATVRVSQQIALPYQVLQAQFIGHSYQMASIPFFSPLSSLFLQSGKSSAEKSPSGLAGLTINARSTPLSLIRLPINESQEPTIRSSTGP